MSKLVVGKKYKSITIDAPDGLITVTNVRVLDILGGSDGTFEYVLGVPSVAVKDSWILDVEEEVW
jgi:hypothetical protein